MIPREYVDRFTRAINLVSERSRLELAAALEQVDMTQDVATVRQQVVDIMQAYCGGSTDLVAQLAAEFYDGLRKYEVGKPLGAYALSGRDPAATEGAIRAFADKLVDGNVEAFVELCLQRLDYECKVAASKCVIENGRRDPMRPKYARVPTGAETCDFCLMLASRGFAYLSEETASHTHSNCVVGDTKVSGTRLLACMRREYEGPLIHIVTRANRELTVTPNHPILTTRGWVSAGEVVESDNLICANLFDGHGASVPDIDDEPPTIEQVFKAGSFFDSSALDCMPATTKYLHREAFSDCDVKVVNPFGLLERAFESSSAEPITHEGFTFAGESGAVVGKTLDGDGALDAFIDSGNPAKRGTVGGFCLGCSLFWRHFGRSDQSSVRMPTKFNTSFSEPSSYGWTAYTESSGNGIDAFSIIERFDNAIWHSNALTACLDAISSQGAVDGGLSNTELVAYLAGAHSSLIEVDDVLSVSVRNSSCHVYNLSTGGGWYLSSGIITHNCDCRVVPSWKAFEVEGYDPAEYYDQWQEWIDATATERAERKGTSFDEERRAIMQRYSDASKRARRR